jgi:hypothetical protein
LEVYDKLYKTYKNINYGFIDIHTYEGELIKASFGLEIIPWTFYV